MKTLTADTRIRLNQIKELRELIEDAKRYEINEISEKTGLQKCLVEGRIVWLLPVQNQSFSNESLGDAGLKRLAKSAKKARAAKPLNNLTIKDIKKYLIEMSKDWKNNPVKCPFLGNTRVRFDDKGFEHFFKTKGKERPKNEVIERAECLPFMRDIIERSGKPAEHLKNKNGESYSIIGKAIINGKERGIKVIIERRPSGNYFYFSLNSYKKI